MRTIVRGQESSRSLTASARTRSASSRRLERLLDDRSDAISSCPTSSIGAPRTPTSPRSPWSSTGRPCTATRRAQLPGGARHGRRQGRAAGRGPQGAAARCAPDRTQEKAILRRIADGTAGAPASERRVVKTKRFAIEPMFEEDAIAAMEELGHGSSCSSMPRPSRSRSSTRATTATTALIEPIVGGDVHGGSEAHEVRLGPTAAAEPPAAQRLRSAPIPPAVPGQQPLVDHVAAQRRDVRVEDRQPLVDLLLGIRPVLGEAAVPEPAQDDQALRRLGPGSS